MSTVQIADRIARIRESLPQNKPLVKGSDLALRESDPIVSFDQSFEQTPWQDFEQG